MTITVRVDESTEAKLRRLLKERGSSLSDFVRAAIAEKLEREAKKPTPYELGKHLFGRHGSGRSDLATNSEQILREMFRAKHRR
jgi:Arc/MetJ-type ribon-helix-helix transcriptional regulator